MSWLFPFPFSFLSRVLRDIEAQYENGQNERHEEDDPTDLVVDETGRLQGVGVQHDTSPKWSRAPLLASSGPVMVVSHGTATARFDDKGRPVAEALLAAIRRKGGSGSRSRSLSARGTQARRARRMSSSPIGSCPRTSAASALSTSTLASVASSTLHGT